MFERFTDEARRAVVTAQNEAKSLGHSSIGTEHLLLGILGVDSPAREAIESHGVDHAQLLEVVRSEFGTAPVNPSGHIPFTPDAKKALELGLREALNLGHGFIGAEHLLLGMLRDESGTAVMLLTKIGIEGRELRARVLSLLTPGGGSDEPSPMGRPVPPMGGPRSSRRHAESMLETFGRNLTRLARAGKLDPVIGRDTETQRVIQTLVRRSKNNPVLIGEPGVGKSAVIEGLATAIAENRVPDPLRDVQIYDVNIGALVAGTRYRGDFEERMRKLIEEAGARDDVIMFLDEIHTVVGAGSGEGAMDAGNLLKPALARGELRVIGATTLDEYRKHFEKDAALERRFQKIIVEPPSVATTIEILKGLRGRYEDHHQLTYTDAAIEAAVRLSDRYVSDRFLPDKAIDLIDEAGARVRLRRHADSERDNLTRQLADVVAAKAAAIAQEDYDAAHVYKQQEADLRTALDALAAGGDHSVVDADTIAEVLAQATGIPVGTMTATESTRLLHLEDELHRRVIGQDAAVSALARAIRRTRAGLKDPNRPGGAFIFAGPTGVGKTELAKALSECLFGDDDALITLDMSEFAEKHTVSRLFGAPPGYVGFDEGGQLTEKIRRRPFSVLLLDEIEKAHPDVFNTMLQVLEEGRLTDAQGRAVDFRNTIIVMTTNLGARDAASSPLGFANAAGADAQRRSRVEGALKTHFRPEFLNRIDDIVVFDTLRPDEVRTIVDIMVAKIADRLADRQIALRLDDAACSWLAEHGYDEQLGARPLRRLIQREIEDLLSSLLLDGSLGAGSVARIGVSDGALHVTVDDARPAPALTTDTP